MKLKPNLHEGPGSDHGSKIGGFSPIIRLNKKKIQKLGPSHVNF